MTKNLLKLLTHASFVVVLLFAIQLPACAEQSETNYHYSDLNEFWTVFKKAALTGDKATMEKLTQYPIKVQGLLDSDPVVKMDKLKFAKNIDAILAQDPGSMKTDAPKTMLELFRRTHKVKDLGGGFARVGNLEFFLIKGRWLLVSTYLDPEDIK